MRKEEKTINMELLSKLKKGLKSHGVEMSESELILFLGDINQLNNKSLEFAKAVTLEAAKSDHRDAEALVDIFNVMKNTMFMELASSNLVLCKILPH